MVNTVTDDPRFAVLDHDDELGEHVERHRGRIVVMLALLLVVGAGVSLSQGWVPTPSFSFASADETEKEPGLIERSIAKAHRTQVTSDAHQVSVAVVAALTEPGASVRSVFDTRPPADVTGRVRHLGFDPTQGNRVHLLSLRGDDYVVCVSRPDLGPSATYRSRANKVSTRDEACPTR